MVIKNSLFLFFAAVVSTLLKAQEDVQNVEINMRTDKGRWYASPWVWIAGAAVFILLLVSLTKEKKEGGK